MENQPGDTNLPKRATRARPIPGILPNPDGTVQKLSKKMRGIVRRIPTANKLDDIAAEMRCSRDTVSRTFHLPAVQSYLRTQLEAAGITHGLLMTRIREGLDATKEGRDGERVDHSERRANVELALKLQGLAAPAPVAGESQGINSTTIFNIVLQARERRGLEPKPVEVEPEPEPPEEKPE